MKAIEDDATQKSGNLFFSESINTFPAPEIRVCRQDFGFSQAEHACSPAGITFNVNPAG